MLNASRPANNKISEIIGAVWKGESGLKFRFRRARSRGCAGGVFFGDFPRDAALPHARPDAVRFKKWSQLLGAEVRKDMLTCAQRWNPALSGEGKHFFRGGDIRLDVVHGVGVTQPVEFIHGAVAPRAPRFDVEFESHGKLLLPRAVVSA